ncbi:MAG: DUF6152 family protein [Steroidobacteraceae bacterium]
MKRYSMLASLAMMGTLMADHAQAHHSFAMFDSTKCFTMDGVVRKVEWNYPHVWLWLTPINATADVLWGFEGAAPQALLTRGLNKKTLAIGTKISLTYRPMKTGEQAGQLGTVTLPDGKQAVVQTLSKNCTAVPVSAAPIPTAG